MTGGRGVFLDGSFGMFTIDKLTDPGGEHSSHLTNIFHVTVTPQCVLLIFVLGGDQQGPYDLERFVV